MKKIKKPLCLLIILAFIISLFPMYKTNAASKQELSYFVSINSKVVPLYNSYSQIAVYQTIMKKFNVKINFVHPPVGGENDQFNLMIASGKLPDIIEWNWQTYSGGPVKALIDKVIIRLNDYIDKYAPNYKKYLEKDTEAKKLVTTDDGDLYMFAFIREKQWMGIYYGPQLRRDWLKKLGLQPPETVDEWYNVLKVFKSKDPNGNGKADEIPFSSSNNPMGTFNNGFIIGAWGILPGFYQENGKVKFGALQSQFKTFMQTMQKWYKEGLIDPSILAPDSKRWEAKILSNEIGSWQGLGGGNLAKYLNAKKGEDPTFDIVGTPYPVLKKGQVPEFSQMDYRAHGVGAALTSKCKNIQLAMKILDWGYSKEGYEAFNFGIKGKTWNINKNGEPQYTDEILKNPQGLDAYTALAKYGRACYDGPFVQSEYYAKQLIVWPQQYEAVQNWSKASNKKRIPPLSLTTDEAARLSNIMNKVNTYFSEMFSKLIAGQTNDFNGLVKTIQRMGIEEAIKIQQAAYNRYLKR